MKREHLYALPGDSPLGLRLPLGSLPELLPDEVEQDFPVDPFAPRQALPAREPLSAKGAKVRGSKPREVIKTALTLQVRDGHLFVFMPPCEKLEAYVALLAVIEDTARDLAIPVAIEGYTPPRDPRIKVLMVTPDPGVIEVNIHPAASWRELLATTTKRCTRRRGRRGSAPRNSCSTAATPAPAAAITSRSAAPLRPTARCCDAPTCCKA